jgi:hypothetical protein
VSAFAFVRPPDRIQVDAVTIMGQTTADDLSSIQRLWPSFEHRVGLRGRKMYALVDTAAQTYTACTPVLERDRPRDLDLVVGT